MISAQNELFLFISDFNSRINVAGIERGKGFGSPAALLSSAVFTVPFSAVRFNLGVTKTLHTYDEMREKYMTMSRHYYLSAHSRTRRSIWKKTTVMYEMKAVWLVDRTASHATNSLSLSLLRLVWTLVNSA